MKVVATEKAPKALGPYSQGYVHGGMFYSAGQIPIRSGCRCSRSGDNRRADRTGMQEPGSSSGRQQEHLLTK